MARYTLMVIALVATMARAESPPKDDAASKRLLDHLQRASYEYWDDQKAVEHLVRAEGELSSGANVNLILPSDRVPNSPHFKGMPVLSQVIKGANLAPSVAVREKWIDVALQLIDRGAEIDRRYGSRWYEYSPFTDAVTLSSPRLVERMLKKDRALARIERAFWQEPYPILFHALAGNFSEDTKNTPAQDRVRVAQSLVDAGADINVGIPADFLKAHDAARKQVSLVTYFAAAGSAAAVRFLLSKGARVTTADLTLVKKAHEACRTKYGEQKPFPPATPAYCEQVPGRLLALRLLEASRDGEKIAPIPIATHTTK